MKKLVKFGVGLSLLGTLVACSNDVETETVESNEESNIENIELAKQETRELKADEEFGKFVGFDEEGLKSKYKTTYEIEMLTVMQDDMNGTALDSTTDTFYIFSNNDEWTNFLMTAVRNNNANGEIDEVIEGYQAIVDIIPNEYNVVISNPVNTNNALMVYQGGELVYSVFE